MHIINFLLSCYVILTFSVLLQGTRTKISIYYETLCIDSKIFIEDLAYAYGKLRHHVKLDFVPFGKAQMGRKFNGERMFRCQHGKGECYGNAIHACVLDQKLGDYKNLQFINCSLVEKRIYNCVELSGINKYLLTRCMNTKGASLLASCGRRTFEDLKTISFVPTVVFDNKYDNNLQNLALQNISYTICLLQNNPIECNNIK